MQTTHLWQLWPGRHWPLLPEEEATFRSDLATLSKNKKLKHDRGDYTAILNAIRCGIDATTLTSMAPGLRPGRLLGAYDHLDSLRAASVAAWASIVADPTPTFLAAHMPLASLLLPVPLERIRSNALFSGGSTIPTDVAATDAVVQQLDARALLIESALRSDPADPIVAVALGRDLYNPYDPTLWGDKHYLPARVGSLMPPRVAALLGERRR